jgi:hypothetical protein
MATTASMGTQGFKTRVQDYKASKTTLFWACAACIVATVAIGFTWGGWTTGASARMMGEKAATTAEANLAGGICATRFATGPDVQAQTALLMKTATYDRADFLVKGGWLALPGQKEPIAGAADLCAQQIASAVPPAK